MNYILRRAGKDQSSVKALCALSSDLKVWKSNKDWPADLGNGMIFRWGCQSFQLPMERTVNPHSALVFASDKRRSRKVFSDAGIAPRTWLKWHDWYAEVDDDGPNPKCIVRPTHHTQGQNFHVCDHPADVRIAAELYGEGNYYISELIQKTKEYRVFVVSGRVAWIANKIPGNPDDVAWNHELGGHFENLPWMKWPSKACQVAIKAMELAGLDFGGVDVMRDSEGKMYVLEINTACTLNSEYRQKSIAKCFDYIISNGKGIIPVGPNPSGYLSYIHPAVSEGALV